MRRHPVQVLAADIVGEFGEQLLRVVDRQIGLLDPGDTRLADGEFLHDASCGYFGRKSLVKVDGKSTATVPVGCR